MTPSISIFLLMTTLLVVAVILGVFPYIRSRSRAFELLVTPESNEFNSIVGSYRTTFVNPKVNLISGDNPFTGYDYWLKSREVITRSAPWGKWIGEEAVLKDGYPYKLFYFDSLTIKWLPVENRKTLRDQRILAIISDPNDKNVTYSLYFKDIKECLIDNESGYRDRILKMSLQYNNFPTYTFEIDGSILFRDILYNINKVSQWAVSLRFVNSVYKSFNSTNYKVSSEYFGKSKWNEKLIEYFISIQLNFKTDINRIKMPFSIHSKYWVGMNLKTLLEFLPMLRDRMPDIYDVYGRLFELQFAEKYDIDITKYYSKKQEGINQYFDKDYENFEEGVTRLGDMIILKQKMGPLLFSQFLRQSNVIIKGFYNSLEHKSGQGFMGIPFTAEDELKITYIADYNRYLETVSKRTCWFSMSDGTGINSWSSVLDNVLKEMDETTDEGLEQFKELLPCTWSGDKCTSCKFFDDVKYRNEGLESANLPCALLSNKLQYAQQRLDESDNKLNRLYYNLQLKQHQNHNDYSLYDETIKLTEKES